MLFHLRCRIIFPTYLSFSFGFYLRTVTDENSVSFLLWTLLCLLFIFVFCQCDSLDLFLQNSFVVDVWFFCVRSFCSFTFDNVFDSGFTSSWPSFRVIISLQPQEQLKQPNRWLILSVRFTLIFYVIRPSLMR